ncbi:MAG TPA: GntR family transcriptional regulator [Chloroflexota bacterium]
MRVADRAMPAVQLSTGGASFQTKQQFAYQVLRQAIMRCELLPGKRLIIDDIARQLGMSLIPVREALQLLQSEGLIDTVPHVGAVVAPISRSSVIDTFTVMEGIETVAMRTAAERMTADDLLLLRELVDQMDAAVAADEHQRWGDLNTDFHVAIARTTAMPLLLEVTRRAFSAWDRIRRYYFDGVLVRRIPRSQQQHHAIVAALEGRDLPALEALARLHNQEALAAYLSYMPADGAATAPSEKDQR